MYDLIIIGSGPAGLSAAVYGKRAGLSTLVLEKSPMSGGQVLNTYEVDNYLGMPGVNGFDMGMQFREHADRLGAEFREAEVLAVEDCGNYKVIKTDKEELQTRAVIIAAGASHRHLGVPGEDKFAGLGVSYCATCDGAFFRGKDTVVVGGGDVAAEDAIFLARTCRKVYLVHRRDELRAAKSLQNTLFSLPNVEIIWNAQVCSINGTETVESVTMERNDGTEQQLEVQGVFIAVGITPNSAQFTDVVESDRSGYLKAAEDCATSVKGIYAVGDIRTKRLRQIVTAVADGANAVNSVQEYMIEADADAASAQLK